MAVRKIAEVYEKGGAVAEIFCTSKPDEELQVGGSKIQRLCEIRCPRKIPEVLHRLSDEHAILEASKIPRRGDRAGLTEEVC